MRMKFFGYLLLLVRLMGAVAKKADGSHSSRANLKCTVEILDMVDAANEKSRGIKRMTGQFHGINLGVETDHVVVELMVIAIRRALTLRPSRSATLNKRAYFFLLVRLAKEMISITPGLFPLISDDSSPSYICEISLFHLASPQRQCIVSLRK